VQSTDISSSPENADGLARPPAFAAGRERVMRQNRFSALHRMDLERIGADNDDGRLQGMSN
jgi:hypothetical protein